MTNTNLSASELRYRRLFETARDGILIVDPVTRKIVDVNPFLTNFLGYTHAEFVGRELFEIGLLRDQAASQAAFRELRRAGFIRYEDLPLVTKAGLSVDVEFVSNLYTEGNQLIIQCNVRDITVRKKNERMMADLRDELARHATMLESTVLERTAELRQSNAQLETFVYSIAHDLRAPLRTMQGFAELLVGDYGATLDARGREFANFINAAAQKMDHLLNDLLAFSHLSQQKIDLQPVALDAAVEEAVAACELEIRESRARIECQPPWPAVMAHPATLRQVLVNLISNAVKFVRTVTPLVRLRAEEQPGGMVRVRVEDNGIGIPAEFQERIFQVFHRLHTTKYPGTGIGLAIVQKGVERMRGNVGVTSAENQGSTFWIDLIRATPAAATAAAGGTGATDQVPADRPLVLATATNPTT
jgi:PAS domain S-box-containing protein